MNQLLIRNMSKKIFLPLFVIFLGIVLFSGCIQQGTPVENPPQTQPQTPPKTQPQPPPQTVPQTPPQTLPETPTQTPPQPQSQGKTYVMDEVVKHNTRDDCWLVIHGKVYDVTAFIPMHPGGSAILQGCGKDATNLFETRPMGSGIPHSQRARDLLVRYFIGIVAIGFFGAYYILSYLR